MKPHRDRSDGWLDLLIFGPIFLLLACVIAGCVYGLLDLLFGGAI